jgi:hypothetical protein
MEPDMEINPTDSVLTFYPDNDNNAVIRCPACGHSKKIDASKYQNAGNALSVKCKCGDLFKCAIDFRKFYRKKVNLSGEYIVLKNQRKGDMLVDDVSMGGLGFINMTPHNLEKGDILEVKFRLDDKKRTELIRKVRVMIIKGHFVGTEFFEKNRFDKELGFYLAP